MKITVHVRHAPDITITEPLATQALLNELLEFMSDSDKSSFGIQNSEQEIHLFRKHITEITVSR